MSETTTTAGEAADTTKTTAETPATDPLAGMTSHEIAKLRERVIREQEEKKKEKARRPRNPNLAGMTRVMSGYYTLTKEAVLASRFEKDGHVYFRAPKGILVGQEVRFGAPAACFVLLEPALLADDSGRIQEVPAGKRYVFRVPLLMAGALESLWPRSDIHPNGQNGCPIVAVEPTLSHDGAESPFVRHPDGSEDMCGEIHVEVDPSSRSGVKLVSLESALGVAAQPPAPKEDNGAHARAAGRP